MRHSPARPLRTVDLLRPHLTGVGHALDLHPGDPDLRGVLGLPADVAHVPVTSPLAAARDASCLLVTRLRVGGDPAEVAGDLDDAGPGARALVLLLGPPESLPVLGLGSALAEAGWRVLAFGELLYELAPGALVAVRDEDGDDLGEDNRRVLERALVPLLLARLDADEDGQVDDAGHLRDRLAQLERQLERLRDDASERRGRERSLERELRQARRRLAQMEASTSYRVGHALVRTSKNPKAVTRLPREVARAVRDRGTSASVTVPGNGTGPPDATSADARGPQPAERRRLVDGLSVAHTADVAPNLALVGTPRLATLLGRHASVTTLLPHDADLLLERLRPAALVVQASAVLRGSPWAGAGTSVSVERDRDLARLLTTASSAGVPTVWWWDAPAAALPLLRAVAATCDVVFSADGRLGPAWTPGADLHALDLAAHHAAAAGGGVVHVHTGGPRAPVGLLRDALRVAAQRARTRVVVDVLDHPRLADITVETGAELALADPHDASAVYADAAVVLASPFTVAPDGTDALGPTLAALLAGARVITGPNPALQELVGELVTVVTGADELPGALEAALAAEPMDDAQRWRQLRRLAAVASPYTALRRLGSAVGGALDPAPQRAVTVVAEFGGHDAVVDDRAPGDPDALIDGVLAQRDRPQVLVARGVRPGHRDRALAELEAAGIQVVATARADGALPSTVDTPWTVRLDAGTRLHPDHLHELLLAAELGPRPDVVGFAGRLGPTEDLPPTGTLLRSALVGRRAGGSDRAMPLGRRTLGVPPIHLADAPTDEGRP
ncbi:hypothetical protein [Egicoccus halophilus]|uniref:Glycosyl transferases group 1 n=1 Tax=Egicoccus halophilus TaxID=1670830 RepID=A0A8J3EUJ3_9ACTN|nr:hypothetical protein [Egicoccus halophilus]GGI05971.1 hypothetical protein GCM10011354_16770 [Egicoccus halophilus]